MKGKIFQGILLVVFLGLIFLYSFNQIAESDVFYHLTAGRVIWETKTIPHQDIFSYTAQGRPWIVHEWLAQVIFYLVYAAIGFPGLLVFVSLVAVLIYYLIFRLALHKGVNFSLALFFMFLVGYLDLIFMVPRPQIFAYLALILLIWFLELFREKQKSLYLWLAVLVVWFWANVNASFILGLVVIIFYFCLEICKLWKPDFFGQSNGKKYFKNLGFAALGSILISFANPSTYHVFLYSFYVKYNARIMNVLEWKSILLSLSYPRSVICLIQLAIIDSVLIWWFGFRKKSRDFNWLGLVLGISILPFIAVRHFGFWPIVAVVPFAVAVSGFLKERGFDLSGKKTKWIIFAIGLFFLVARIPALPNKLINEYQLPVKAVDFIKENNLKGPLFNLYNDGCYLMWRLWPGEKVFIDGRSEVYGPAQVSEFFGIVGGLPDWEELVNKKYKINYFILSYWPQSLSDSIAPLISKLDKYGWKLVWWDDGAVVFVRPSKENEEIIKKFAYSHISPFRDPKKIFGLEAKAAEEEIKTLLDRAPDSLMAHSYALEFLTSR